MLTETDIVIVGGGPAGLATALELRRLGRDPVVVDRAEPPIDKACGEGLMPDGLAALRELGVDLEEVCWAPFHGIRYIEGDIRAEASFAGGPGAGIRRTTLHRAMVDRAASVGIRATWGVTVRGLDSEGLDTDRGRIRAEWVIGADGLHSKVRQWASLNGREPRFRRYAIRRHYQVSPWSDRVEVYWADGVEAYVTPVSAGEVGVAILWSGEKIDFEKLLPRFPSLKDRLVGASASSHDRGAALLEQRTRGVFRGRVVLVGDAAGYRDAITGEGLSLAFHEARALAKAIVEGRLDPYARAVRKLSRLPFLLIRLLLEVEHRPRLRRRLLRTLAAEPELFARLLAIHTRQAPVRSVGPGGVLRLARGLLGYPPRAAV